MYQDNDDNTEALMGMVIEIKKIHCILPCGEYAVEPIRYILFRKDKAYKEPKQDKETEYAP